MDVAREIDEQAALWNGPAGRAWVEEQEALDRMFKPFEGLLVEAVTGGPRGPVLDVGCGTGATTRAVARALGTHDRCLGVDISQAMIAVARARAERDNAPADFICANAEVHAFEPATFATIVSRFGVMFFADPVAAFANLRRAARDDGRCHFIAWRSAADNPFMTTAERAAAPLVANLPARRPDGPGQFALADQHRVYRILEESGWTGIDIRPIDVECTFPETELVGYLSRLGPVGLALQDADDRTRAHVVETVRAAFDPYVHGPHVRFTAACWTIEARSR